MQNYRAVRRDAQTSTLTFSQNGSQRSRRSSSGARALSPSCDEIRFKCRDVTILCHQISIAVTPTPPRLSRLNAPHLPQTPPCPSSVHLGLRRLTAELISRSGKSQTLADQTATETLPRKTGGKARRTCFSLFDFFFFFF